MQKPAPTSTAAVRERLALWGNARKMVMNRAAPAMQATHVVAFALEDMVGSPPGEERAADSGNLESGDGPACLRDIKTAALREEFGPPVEDAHANDIDKEVGDAEGPYPTVLPYHDLLKLFTVFLVFYVDIAEGRAGEIRKSYFFGLIA